MKTNLIPAGSVKIDDLNIGDSFISIATSDIKIPAEKQAILDATEKEVDKAERTSLIY